MREPVTLGPSASDQWLHAPEHLAMVLARYRVAAALIGDGTTVLEVGCGEGIGTPLLAARRPLYIGVDPDVDAIAVAVRAHQVKGPERAVMFLPCRVEDPRGLPALDVGFSGAVALDVLEHVEDGAGFLDAIVTHLTPHGVCVIGTPNAAFDHLASPQSRMAHVRTYHHDELYALMVQRFRVVQSFGMQDVALHLGHPEARHYLLMCGIGLR